MLSKVKKNGTTLVLAVILLVLAVGLLSGLGQALDNAASDQLWDDPVKTQLVIGPLWVDLDGDGDLDLIWRAAVVYNEDKAESLGFYGLPTPQVTPPAPAADPR